MKYILSLLMLTPLLVSSQITKVYNSPRSGDELWKQQVQFKDPGRSGENVIWDFGQLNSINDEYTLTYTSPNLQSDKYIMGADTIYTNDIQSTEYLIGTEHSTMYYLKNTDTGLNVIGHENATTSLQYNPSLLSVTYPTNYGELHTQEYQSRGLYSSRIPFETSGNVQQVADAYGVMILPTGDTLKNVMRVKTIQSIHEIIYDVNNNVSNEIQMNVENYKWYSKGYRYPIFETVKTVDSLQIEEFSTAFFFPPQEHYYLDTDPDNLAVLDSLWNLDQKVVDPLIPDDKPVVNLSYNFYPNPVSDILNVEYYLEQPSSVTISLYNMSGQLIKTVVKSSSQVGIYKEQIDCSTLSNGTYVITIGTGYKIYSDKIIKK